MADESAVQEKDPGTPKAYPVNRKSYKVQDTFTEDDDKYVVTVEYKRLDATNYSVLLEKETATKRITETMTKNRSRDRLSVDEAQDGFFNALAIGGWLKVNEEEEETLSYHEVVELNIEQKIGLNIKFLDCKAKVKKVVGAGKHAFLFERDGQMIVEFLIGDPESPVWKLLMRCKRPRQSRRSKFRDDFSYAITNRGGDLPITETHIDIGTGIRFFDEYFETIINDTNYSTVAFLKEENGKEVLDHTYVEGDDNDRKQLLQFINPHFKVEVSGAIIATFNKSGRDS